MPPTPSIIVVGAGADHRMRSTLPKAMHTVCGSPMVTHVLAAVGELDPRRLGVVLSPNDDETAKHLVDFGVDLSHVAANVMYDDCAAVLAALSGWGDDDLDLELDPDDDDILVVSAALPLLRGETLRRLYRAHRRSDASATALLPPRGEDSDCLVWFVRRSLLAPALRRAETPSISALGAVLRETGHYVHAVEANDERECRAVLDRTDLAEVEAVMRERINARWMRRGVTMIDPAHTYVDATVEIGADVVLAAGTVLEGATTIGAATRVGPGCRLVDTRIGAQCRLASTFAELATVGDDARVGPFAVLEPGADIPSATVTGSFYTAGPDAP